MYVSMFVCPYVCVCVCLSMCVRVCVWCMCVPAIIDVKVLLMQEGNLMFAADCPTKRAAFMVGMTLGRWSHVPAHSNFRCDRNRLSLEPARRSFVFTSWAISCTVTAIWDFVRV